LYKRHSNLHSVEFTQLADSTKYRSHFVLKEECSKSGAKRCTSVFLAGMFLFVTVAAACIV